MEQSRERSSAPLRLGVVAIIKRAFRSPSTTVANFTYICLVSWHINHYKLMPNPFLYISTVLFQTIQFSISTLFSSIWTKDRILSGAATPSQSGPGSDGNSGLSVFPQAPALQELPHQVIWCHIQNTHWSSLTRLQRCSRCILQHQPTWPIYIYIYICVCVCVCVCVCAIIWQSFQLLLAVLYSSVIVSDFLNLA